MSDGSTSGYASQTDEGESPGTEDKARQVAGQAQEKAHETTAKAQGMLREQVDQRSTQAGEKVTGTAGDLRSIGAELRNQGKEAPAKFAEKAAERTEQVGSYLTESSSEKLLADVEDMGRRQPLAMLAGGVAVGLVAARFLKASSRNRYQGRTSSEAPTREQSAPPPLRQPVPEPVPPPAQADVATPTDPVLGR